MTRRKGQMGAFRWVNVSTSNWPSFIPCSTSLLGMEGDSGPS